MLSRRLGESTTETVTDWLERLGGRYFRLNVEDLQYPSSFSYEPLDGVLRIHDHFTRAEQTIKLDEVRVVWYRRWSYFGKYCKNHVDAVYDQPHKQYELADYLSQEMNAVGKAIFAGLRSAHWLSDAHTSKTDKMMMLMRAKEVGLDVPATIIATTRDAMIEFAGRHERVITKALGLGGYISGLQDHSVAAYTSTVSEDTLRDQPPVFFPSLMQATVDKAYELRCFVLGDEVHSMAIFSQGDSQTSVDFRRYNRDTPNRTVPYQLAAPVRDKLLALFRALGLDTGSADLIRTRDGRYVFLEINPIGQFGMVSIPCNYGLEEKVARHLIAHDKN